MSTFDFTKAGGRKKVSAAVDDVLGDEESTMEKDPDMDKLFDMDEEQVRRWCCPMPNTMGFLGLYV